MRGRGRGGGDEEEGTRRRGRGGRERGGGDEEGVIPYQSVAARICFPSPSHTHTQDEVSRCQSSHTDGGQTDWCLPLCLRHDP